MPKSSSPEQTLFSHLRRAIDEVRIGTVFQPIVDLMTGTPIGYEVLSRPEAPFKSIEQLFAVAKHFDASWDLDRACRSASFARIATLGPELRSQRFFINVSPDILSDPRFVEGFTRAQIAEYGLDQSNIVIEITESESVGDYRHFETLIRHYEHQGFRIALDDFGSGHSSLVTLISCAPHFLKLDREVVRHVHRHSYKQRLVRALVGFAASVETKLIAEGVELWEELEVLSRLGIRYSQGFLLAHPAHEASNRVSSCWYFFSFS